MDRLADILSTLSHLDLRGEIVQKESVQAGLGGTCDVFTAWSNKHNCKVAVKRIRVFLRKDEKFAKRLAKEVRIWATLDHEYVLPLLGYFVEESDAMPSLVSLWMENGTVDRFMNNFPRGGQETWNVLAQIVRGLEYLHSKSVIHADLKSANILISKDLRPQLTDFGLSTTLSSSTTVTFSATGTVRWMAVELFHVRADDDDTPVHNEATDIWAFGMVAYELLSGKIPYHNRRVEFSVSHAITNGELPAKPNNEHQLVQFDLLWAMCQSCWRKAPEERPAARNLVDLLGAEEHSRSISCDDKPDGIDTQPSAPSDNSGPNDLDGLTDKMTVLLMNTAEPMPSRHTGSPAPERFLGNSRWTLADFGSPFSDPLMQKSPNSGTNSPSEWVEAPTRTPSPSQEMDTENSLSVPASPNMISNLDYVLEAIPPVVPPTPNINAGKSSVDPSDDGSSGSGLPPAIARSPLPGSDTNDSSTGQSSVDEPVLFYVQALHNYNANVEEEINFVTGDIIAVTATSEDGWWFGIHLDETKRVPGRTIFPSSLVRLAERLLSPTHSQHGGRNRYYYACDSCKRGRLKCDLRAGVPCRRCLKKQSACLVKGCTREANYQILVQENGNCQPRVFNSPERDSYVVLLGQGRFMRSQHVTLHFVKIGPPIPLNAQTSQAFNSTQEANLAGMHIQNIQTRT